MVEEILKGVSLVFLPSMLKFLFGPLAGKAAGLGLVTTMIFTAAGMMASVVAFTYFGEFLRSKILKYLKLGPKPEYSETKSSFFRKYGLAGIALLTPVVLTPIGGTLLAVGASANKKKILIYMLISACFWAVVITSAVYFGYDAILKVIKQIQPL